MDEDESGPLCCCEYVNDDGDKNHLLALCCDCQELDQACDRLLKGRQLEHGSLGKVLSVAADRVRVPTCFGAGARRMDQLLDLTALPPALVVPLWVYAASLHPAATALTFLTIPVGVLVYHRTVLRHRRRTQFFMSWGLVSVGLVYAAFYSLVGLDVDAVQFSAVTILFVLTLLAFFASKHGPGVVVKRPPGPSAQAKNLFRVRPRGESSSISDDDAATVMKRNHHSDRGVDLNEKAEEGEADRGRQETSALIGREAQARDEAADRDAEQWCEVCELLMPQRAGHCKICGHCVQRFDHHCVWIDSCIGAGNHRSFLLAALLFMVGGSWGGYLSLDHLCSLRLDRLPDCSDVYSTRRTAVIFVCVLYTALAVTCVAVLFLQQFHLITHNWTYRERRLAARSHRVGEALAERDMGFLANWRNFLLMRLEEEPCDRAAQLSVV